MKNPRIERGSVRDQLALVVEREGQARALQAQILQQLGLEVEVAPDGAAALDRARELARALVLVVSEILIPKLDGLALCRQLKSSPETRRVPVLLVSVLSAGARALAAGADGFLLKPISIGKLGGEVARLVPQPRSLAMAEGET